MPADPKFSAGARYERKAFRERLRRMANAHADGSIERAVYEKEVAWVIARQQRYDKRRRGL
jgi:hypothetical protein